MPNSDSKYEEDFPTKEKTYKEEPLDTADINMLTKEHNGIQDKQNREEKNETDDEYETSHLWSMIFDGSCTKTGVGAGIWVHNKKNNHAEGHSYKLKFQCTNNIAEYEALLLGIHLLKKLGAKRIIVHQD